jgi:hypothetical protein
VTPEFWLEQWKLVLKVLRRGKRQGSKSSVHASRRPGSIKLKDSGMKKKSFFYKLLYYKINYFQPYALSWKVMFAIKQNTMLKQ